jgi:hypothetical protein
MIATVDLHCWLSRPAPRYDGDRSMVSRADREETMPGARLPRYFVPRRGRAPTPIDPSAGIARVLDVFGLPTDRGEAEWVVGLDDAGNLTALPAGQPDALSPAMQGWLSFHEVSSGVRRVLDFPSLFLFTASLLEQTPDTPGLNDPVHLHGTLVGPISSDPRRLPPHRVDGQLTAGRGDVMTALVAGTRWPFRQQDRTSGRVARTFSLLLGADREEAVEQGQGVVVVYPLLTPDPAVGDLFVGNEEMVSDLLHDLLVGWWQDAASEQASPYRSATEIPRANGRATADNFLELAAEALTFSASWPSARIRAVNDRVHLIADRAPIESPRSAAPPDPERPSSWVQAFVAAHLGSRAAPRMTLAPDGGSPPRAAAPRPPDAMARTKAVLEMLARKFDEES